MKGKELHVRMEFRELTSHAVTDHAQVRSDEHKHFFQSTCTSCLKIRSVHNSKLMLTKQNAVTNLTKPLNTSMEHFLTTTTMGELKAPYKH